MAQYYFVPKPLAERFPALGRAAQSLEAALLKGLFWCVQRLRPEQALERRVGLPRTRSRAGGTRPRRADAPEWPCS